MAGTTGLEPATSDVTGRRSNQLSYVPALVDVFHRSTGSSHQTINATLTELPRWIHEKIVEPLVSI